MDYKEVDLAVALRAISYHRMNMARSVRRRMKKMEKNMTVLQEQSHLETYLMLASHNVNQLRKAFRGIVKIEKRIKKRNARKVVDQMAGRNGGNFRNR